MNPTRRRVLQGLSAGSLGALAGCSAGDILVGNPTARSSGDSQSSTGRSLSDIPEQKDLSVALSGMPEGLDPLVVDDGPSRVALNLMFEGLFEYDDTAQLVPRLADGVAEASDEARRWTVDLRTEPAFQNGSPVTPSDVKYSFETPAAENTPHESTIDVIDQVSVVDDRTVQFDLEEPDASFPHRLTLPIVPEAVRESDPAAFNREAPIGSGAFEFASWEPETLRLLRSTSYWGDRTPNLDRISFTALNGPVDGASRLRNGESDVVAVPNQPTFSAVSEVETARITDVPQIVYFYLAFNCLEGPTADRRVREAVDYVFDMDRAVSEHVGPLGRRQYTPIPRPVAEAWDMPFEEWARVPHSVNLERARGLFEDAGVPQDYPWRIIVPPDDTREQIARTVAAGLEEAGFTDTTVDRLEWGAFYGRYTSGNEEDYNMFMLGWRNIPDPDAFTFPLFGRTPGVLGVTNGTYYGAHSERGVEAAEGFARGRRTTRRSVRRQLYIDGITTVLEDRAHLPAYTTTYAFGVDNSVNDLMAVPTAERLHLFGADANANKAASETPNE